MTQYRIEALGLIIALFVSISFFFGHLNAEFVPIVIDSDSHQIFNFTSGRIHPGVFENDYFLHNTRNYAHYWNFNAAYVHILTKLFGSNYSIYYYILAIPTAFFFLVGFYLLGRELTGTIWGGLALGLLAPVLVYIPAFATYWGFYSVPQPRWLFAAAFPFLLLATVRNLDRPRRWPLITLACGLATYLHPVSGPPVAASLWLGLLVAGRGGEVTWPRHLSWMVLVGLFYVAVVLPFAIIYLSAVSGTAGSATPESVFDLLAADVDIGTKVGMWIRSWYGWTAALPVLALLGLAIIRHNRREQARQQTLLVVFCAALLFFSIVLPAGQFYVMRALDRYPLEVDIARSVRFIYVMFLVIFVQAIFSLRHDMLTSPIKTIASGVAHLERWVPRTRTARSIAFSAGVVGSLLTAIGIVLSLNVASRALAVAPGQIVHDGGKAYRCVLDSRIPGIRYAFDTSEAPRASPTVVFENGMPLPYPHAAHEDIRVRGGGRFSHWYNALYFSASDGTDVRYNGRHYTIHIYLRLADGLFIFGVIALLLSMTLFLSEIKGALKIVSARFGIERPHVAGVGTPILRLFLIVLLAVGWSRYGDSTFPWPLTHAGPRLWGCWLQGMLLCPPTQAQKERYELLEAIREQTPVGARVVDFTGFLGQAVRFEGWRPLAFVHKDAAALMYNNHAGLSDWNARRVAFEQVRKSGAGPEALEAARRFCTRFGCEYAVVAFTPEPDQSDARTIVATSRGALIALHK